MSESFWKQANYWWVSIVLLLLSGAGWAIKTYLVKSEEPATLIIKVNPPPGRVSLYIDDKKVSETSDHGFFRLDGIAPGDHEIQWKLEGYTSRVTTVSLHGGIQNRIELAKLEPIAEGSNANPDMPVREENVAVQTEIHKWYAGTRYIGDIDLSSEFGHIWHCSGGTCVLEGPYGTGLNMEACQAVARIAGPLEYYYTDSGMTWNTTTHPEMLAQCNAPSSL